MTNAFASKPPERLPPPGAPTLTHLYRTCADCGKVWPSVVRIEGGHYCIVCAMANHGLVISQGDECTA